MEAVEESRLIEEAKNDAEAFGRLYDAFMPSVFAYVMRRVSDRDAAEDITSQTFEKALRSIRGLRKGTSFKGWLFRIAENCVIDHYRSRGRSRSVTLEEAGQVTNGASGKAFNGVDTRLAVEELLRMLPETHRAPLVMHYLEGLTVEQMAAALESTPSACYMKVYRATKAFADLLEQRGIAKVDDYVA